MHRRPSRLSAGGLRGPWGYADLLAALADPNHPDHDENLEWVGGPFDPAEFDPAEFEQNLKSGAMPDP